MTVSVALCGDIENLMRNITTDLGEMELERFASIWLAQYAIG